MKYFKVSFQEFWVDGWKCIKSNNAMFPHVIFVQRVNNSLLIETKGGGLSKSASFKVLFRNNLRVVCTFLLIVLLNFKISRRNRIFGVMNGDGECDGVLSLDFDKSDEILKVDDLAN